MASDIFLKDQTVVVEAHNLRVEANDLELCSNQRLPAAARQQAPLRRALVHGDGDQLIVNFQRDYTHVELHGPLQVKSRRVPASISLYSQDTPEKEVAQLHLGLLRLSRDLLLPIETRNADETRDLDAYRDSVGHTLRWVLQRLAAIEQKLGISPPPRPAANPANKG